MTVLVCMSPEDGGWIMRRWEKQPWNHHVVLTHVGGFPDEMTYAIPKQFARTPDESTKTGNVA